MRSVSIREATLTPVPKRDEREQRPTRRSPFRIMGTGSDGYIRRMPILRSFIKDFSRHTWIYPMRHKYSDTSKNLRATSKRRLVGMLDAFDQMAARSTSCCVGVWNLEWLHPVISSLRKQLWWALGLSVSTVMVREVCFAIEKMLRKREGIHWPQLVQT